MNGTITAALILVLTALPVGLAGLLVVTGKWMPANVAKTANPRRALPWLAAAFFLASLGLIAMSIALFALDISTIRTIVPAFTVAMTVGIVICSMQVQRLSAK